MNDLDLLDDGTGGSVAYKHLPVGCTFYLHAYPGNVYRKVDEKKASFVQNRHDNAYNGCEITMGPADVVQRQPIGYDPNDLLSDGDDASSLLDDTNPNDLLS